MRQCCNSSSDSPYFVLKGSHAVAVLRRPDSLSMNLCDNSEDYSREQVTNRR